MRKFISLTAGLALPALAMASEADLKVPNLGDTYFQSLGMNGHTLLL